jgi:hypothetical protein
MDYIVKPNNVVKPDYSVCQNDPCYADCASFTACYNYCSGNCLINF